MPLRRPPALVLEQSLPTSSGKFMQSPVWQPTSPSVKSSSLLNPPMFARVPLSPLSKSLGTESPAVCSRDLKPSLIPEAVPYSRTHSSAARPGTSLTMHTPSYLSSFDCGWSSPMIRSSSVFASSEPDVTNALGLRGMHVPFVMTNVMYAMRRETGPSVQREDTEDIALQAELYSKEETLRGAWLDSFLEVHKSTQQLQDAISILRTVSEEESTLNDSLLDLIAELHTLNTRLNGFYESAALKWQSCVPEPPESIQSVQRMVNLLAQGYRSLDPNNYLPVIESLIIDVSMDIIVFGDLDHPRHQLHSTVVNEPAPDLPSISHFPEDLSCPSLEFLV